MGQFRARFPQYYDIFGTFSDAYLQNSLITRGTADCPVSLSRHHLLYACQTTETTNLFAHHFKMSINLKSLENKRRANSSVCEQAEQEEAKVYSKEQSLAAFSTAVLPHDCRRWLWLDLLTLLVCLLIEAVSS